MQNNLEVIERLIARRNGKKDKYKIGLIIEGGGMRGAFSGGVMAGLEDAGLANCFDYVYASSSGSCAGAYLLSNQTKVGTAIYLKDLTGYKFIKPWKLVRAADIDMLCDVIFRKTRKLDTEKVKKSKTVFKIFVADAQNGECSFYTNKDDVDLIDVIKASCAMPAFYNKPVAIGKNKHLDGRIGKALPIEDAIADGCTDVLVVTTVPEYYYSLADNIFARGLKRVLMLRLPAEYRKAYRKNRLSNYNESLDIAFGRVKLNNLNVFTIAPNNLPSKFETNAYKLRKLTEQGKAKADEALKVYS